MIEWILKIGWLTFCGLFGSWLGDMVCDFAEAIKRWMERKKE